MARKKYLQVSDMLKKVQNDINTSSIDSEKYVPDIIEFCYSSQYLGLKNRGIKLRPFQSIILKSFYRGSPGNENLALNEEEIELCKKYGLDSDERGNLLEKYYTDNTFRELVLVWGRRCLSEDCYLTDPKDGSLNKIGDLWDSGRRSISSYTYNQKDNKMEIIDDANIIYQGIRPVYKLITNRGHEVEATDNHPFLTQRGWVQLKDIDIEKDKVALIDKEPFFGESKEINKDEAALLGYMTADGCCSQANMFFTCSNEEILKDFSNRLNNISDNLKIFNDPWTGARSKKSQYKITSKYQSNINEYSGERKRIISRHKKNDLALLLQKHDLLGKTCHEKTIPLELFKCPKEVIAEYLRALFSCDGGLVFKRPKGDMKRKVRVSFSFTTVNRDQAFLVRKILSKFGILVRVRRKRSKTKIIGEKGDLREYDSISYIVSFSRKKYILLYLNEINFTGKEGQILEAFDILQGVSDKTTKKINKYNEDISYEKIKSIEPIGEKRTFDLQVSNDPSRQNFVSSLFIIHNSGKDFISSIIAVYEAMRLLECEDGDPYKYYNVSSASPISILTVATAKKQAEIAFGEIKDRILNSNYFKDRIGPEGLGSDQIRLLTPQDIEDNKDLAERGLPLKRGSVVVEVGHSNSDSLLGKGIFVLILDEVASYKMTGSASSGERIYTALSPSLNTYQRDVTVVDEDGNIMLDENGEPVIQSVYDSKIISISSPRGEEGIFFNLFSNAEKVKERLACKLPTWVVNPSLTEQSLRDTNQHMTEEEFMMEFGAEFSGTGGDAFFPRQNVEDCFTPSLHFRNIGEPGLVYFGHLDPSTSSHNYAFVIVHKEIFFNKETNKNDFIIKVDHINYWHPSPENPINVDKIDQYVIDLKRKFHFGMVTYDQWNSTRSINKLRKHGIPSKMTRFTDKYKMNIYTELYNLVISGRLKIPMHSLLRNEMLNLRRKFTPNGYKVFANPDGDTKTDDVIDALAGAVFSSLVGSESGLPRAKVVNFGAVPSQNSRTWQSMSGPIGYGTGQEVSRKLEHINSWPNRRR